MIDDWRLKIGQVFKFDAPPRTVFAGKVEGQLSRSDAGFCDLLVDEPVMVTIEIKGIEIEKMCP